MARINTYQVDGSISANDIVIGSEYNGVNSTGIPIYKTKNYRMSDLQTFLAGGDFEFAAPITIETLPAGNKKWIHDNITVSTPSATTSTLTHSGQFTVVTGITTDSYTEGGSTVTKGHVKQINTATYTLPDYKFNIAADSNPGSDDAVIDINSSSFDTLNVLGGSVLTSKITAGDTITIDHNEYTAKSITTDAVDVLHTFVSDVYGHVTTITKRTLPTFGGADTSANTAGSKGVVPAPAVNDELKFLRGDATWATVVQTSITTTDGTFIDLTPNSATSGSVTVTADLSATGTTSNATFLRGDNQWATPPGTYSFDINADATVSNVNKEITSGQTLNILGGTNLGSTVSANDTITINHDAFSTTTSTHSQSPASPGFGGNFTVLSGLTVSNGHVTDKESIQINMPSLPTYDGDDISIDTSGADVIDTLVVTTNTLGHVTDASATKRALTLADLGYTGATDANNYVLPLSEDGTRGGVQIGYSENGKNYPVELSSEKMFVNVPWDNDTYSAGTGITESSNTFSLTVNSSSADQYNDMLFNIGGVATTGALSWNPAVFKLKVHSDSTGPYVQGSSTNITLNASSNVILQTGGVNRITTNSTSTTITGNISITGTISGSGYNDSNWNTAYGWGNHASVGYLTSLTVTTNTANNYYKIPFMNNNVINIDSSSSSLVYNPSSNVLAVGQISIGTTSTLTYRSIYSESSTSNYFEIANTSTSNGGRLLFGCTTSGFNAIYSRNDDNSAGREFRLIQLSTAVITVATNGNTTVAGSVTATNFVVSSDRRLKSEIKPIKEGLEVIKKFSSYNYIKGGEKESGFIAQEVKEAIPHTVYENNEGYLSMSDRGVLAHMHKAILELEERLTAIENKIK